MGCGGDHTQDDLALRDHRIDHDRAENTVVLAQIDDQVRRFGDTALHKDGGYGRVGHADLESVFLQAVLERADDLPQLLLIFGMVADQLQTLQRAHDHRHRERLGVELRTHVVTQQVHQPAGTADECADTGHRLGESVEQHVHAVGHAEMRSRTAAALAHRTEAVRVVHQQTELEILLQRHDLVEFAQIALHAEDTFGNHEHAALLLLGEVRGMLQLETQRIHVVVSVHETLALVQTQTVDNAGMRLGVVDDHVARRQQAVDNRDHALITEVEQESVLLADELGQLAFELFVINGLTAHHTGAHRGRHTEFGCAFGVGLAHLRMVCQTEVVVQTPVEHLFAPENHVGTDLALQFGEREISVGVRHVLTDRSACIFFKACKNINHNVYNLMLVSVPDAQKYKKTFLAIKISRFLFGTGTHLYLFTQV